MAHFYFIFFKIFSVSPHDVMMCCGTLPHPAPSHHCSSQWASVSPWSSTNNATLWKRKTSLLNLPNGQPMAHSCGSNGYLLWNQTIRAELLLKAAVSDEDDEAVANIRWVWQQWSACCSSVRWCYSHWLNFYWGWQILLKYYKCGTAYTVDI